MEVYSFDIETVFDTEENIEFYIARFLEDVDDEGIPQPNAPYARGETKLAAISLLCSNMDY